MRYWISVIGTSTTLSRLSDNQELWFCFPKIAASGDKVMMYKTRRLSKNQNGLFSSYIVGERDHTKDSQCSRYGNLETNLYSYSLIKVKDFAQPISITKIKESKLLEGSSFISKNAQGTIFEISESQFDALMKL